MRKEITLTLRPGEAFDIDAFGSIVAQKLKLSQSEKWSYRILKRSIDSRSHKVKVISRAEVYINEKEPELLHFHEDFNNVEHKEPVIIVGAGPAGLFAAIRVIELGFKPIILERGKDVRARRRDLAAINREHIVNPDSNYCFGEGGAGTYSDGKLYTRSKKRGDVRRILEILVHYGANENILYEAHPHIGTNKLPNIITSIREAIIDAGGSIHFNTRVTDLIIENSEIQGVKTASGDKLYGLGVVLATGHSARDIFSLLPKKGVLIEQKPFALGVRIEHPQELIDSIQYHCKVRGDYLPAAYYSLVYQTKYKAKQRGVFSFCMCPGGFIVPSATQPGEVVVNGMSPSRRNSKYANSGIVVGIENEDLANYSKSYGALGGMYFQQEIEQKACQVAGGNQTAPAQRLNDFLKGVVSSTLPDCSYKPGVLSTDMREVLPKSIYLRLQDGIKGFNRKMKGYITNEAIMVGVESRTSSPVKVPRDKGTLEHIQIKRLYPSGEGAGYAGGIVSAAMDGEKCAEALILKYQKQSKSANV